MHLKDDRSLWIWAMASGSRSRSRRSEARSLSSLGCEASNASVASMISRTRSDAERFREELRDKARAEAATIVRNAQQQIEMETSRAVQQIRHEAVDLSVPIASKLLQKHVSADDNARLIEDTFKQLESTSGRPN